MSLPRICIDGFNLGLARGSGIATYARNLSLAQKALGHETQVLLNTTRAPGRNALLNEVALFDEAASIDDKASVWDNIRRVAPRWRPTAKLVPLTGRVQRQQYGSRVPEVSKVWANRDVFHSANRAYAAYNRFTPVRLGKSSETDIMHWTCPLPMVEPNILNVYTIHDLVPLILPFTTLDNKRNFFTMCRKIISKADLIVTVSENSRRDIINLLGAPEEKVVNTFQSVQIPAALRDVSNDEIANEIEAVFELPWRGYFLFFGAIEPKKNLARVVEAYLASGVKAPLVIIGGRGWLSEDQTSLLYDDVIRTSVLRDSILRRADRIRQYDYLPFSMLVSLIRGARATLFPSLYEGFGLPILESMLLGTPVLTSTEGSLPEVASDAALFVDPYDSHAIRRAIIELDRDDSLREDLSKRGLARADFFNVNRYQERLASAYARLC